jgi:HlyD family secretion protein
MKKACGRNTGREIMMLPKNKFNGLFKDKRLWIAAGVICIIVVAGAAVFGGGSRTEKVEESVPLFTVKRGPLDIIVTCPGSIVSRDVKILQSELEGRATIISIVPDGSAVKKGDLLVELDASKLVDSRIDQQISVQNAEAAFVQAKEKLAVTENQARADVEKAELDVAFARQDLDKYREGEYPNLLKAAESKITLAEEEVKRANEKLQWSKILFEEKYLSATELQADDLAAKKAQTELELARNELDLLKNFTYKREMARLASDVNQTEMALERTKRKSAADVVQAQAELAARQSEFERQKSKLAKIEEQIAKAKIYAPIDGRAIYATSAKGTRWDEQPLAAGQDVMERQELIYLPTAGSVKAEVKLHESSLRKVREGLPAKVTADAMPNRVFWGTVASIAPLPDARSVWQNPDLKIYPTDIYIEGDVSDLRIGWSCRAEIIVEKYPDTLFVPVQAVTKIDGKPCVYVVNDGRMVKREVTVGLDDGTMVRIESGLKEGEQVVLMPPLERSKTTQQPVEVPEGLGANGVRSNGPARIGPPDANRPAGGAGGEERREPGQRRPRRSGGPGAAGSGPGSSGGPGAGAQIPAATQ